MAGKKKNGALSANALRLIDANLNRAREGLRVVEDTARFLWNDKPLVQRVRRIRHRLQTVTETRYHDLVDSRNSVADVGRRIKETGRASVAHLVKANITRAQEAARVLEEYSKLLSPAAAPELKKIRYQLYTIEKEFLKRIV